MWTDGQMNMGKAGFQIADCVESWVVIGVGADKKMIILIINRGGIMLHHAGDDGVLMPERDKDGDGFLVNGGGPDQGRGSRLWKAPIQPGPKANGIENQVVQTADEDDPGQGDQAMGNA